MNALVRVPCKSNNGGKKKGERALQCVFWGEEKAAEDVHTKTTEGLCQVFKHIPSATFV